MPIQSIVYSKQVHKDRVIDLSEIEEAVVVESRTPAKKTRIADSAEVLDDLFHKKGEVKGRDHEYKGNHVTVGGKVDGPVGMKINKSIPFEKTVTVYKKEAGSDTEVEIDLVYDFTKAGDGNYIEGMLRNIWPTKKSRAITYPILFNSCRKQHQVNIEVYSDIKWILQVGFNYDQEKFNKIRTDEHKKYETKTQELEQAYEKETVSHRQRENDFKEFKKRANRRLKNAEKKVKKNESIHKLVALNEARNKAKRDVEHWEKKLNNHRNKKSIVDKNNELANDKDQAKKDKKDNIKADHKKNLRQPVESIKNGLANVTVGLAAEWDRPYKGVELTANYRKAKEFVDFMVNMEAHARRLVKGKDNKSQSSKEDPDKLEKLKKALKGRPLFTFEIIPPSLGIALSWCAEHPEAVLEPSMGVVWEGEIKAEPLIGFDFNFDVIALVAKAHPIAKGIVTVMDLLASLADKAEIRLDFKVQGKFNIAGKGRVNTANGVTNFNREELSKNDDKSPFVLSGELDFSLVSQIQLINKYESWFWGDVETKFDAGAKLITGILAEGKVGADQSGMYLEPKILFKGIKLVFHLSVSAEARADEDTDPYFEVAPVEEEIPLVLMNAYEWGAAELGASKWYLT